MIPTLFGILAVSFIVIQFAPGGPVERMVARFSGMDAAATSSIGGGGEQIGREGGDKTSAYRGAQGLDPEFIAELERLYGFDKPAHVRFFTMLVNYAQFDLGDSYFQDKPVLTLIAEKLPVSISLGLWSTVLAYFISIPLGIRKAVLDGTKFDVWSSFVIVIGYAIPGFLFAVLLLILFAGGSFLDLFPLRGLVSENWSEFGILHKIVDYFWHLFLPLLSLSLASFATLTLLTKNAFLEEIGKKYVVTARAKGLNENQVLYGHVLQNAFLVVLAGFPAAFMAIFFTGSILIETIFSLDGLGLLAFESILNRDYPVVFGSLFVFSLIGLLINLIADLAYMWLDPRIDFESRAV
jgi:microcin C transport system permease protein